MKNEAFTAFAWLRESPIAKLSGYNPLVMSKMFMLNNVTLWNPFDDEYFFWIDAGISNTVNAGYFYHDKVFDNLPEFIEENNDFVFLLILMKVEVKYTDLKEMLCFRFCNTDYVSYVCVGEDSLVGKRIGSIY